MSDTLAPDTALGIYRRMATVRYGEDRIMKGLGSGEFAFSFYPVHGHEAIAGAQYLSVRPEARALLRRQHDVPGAGAEEREQPATLFLGGVALGAEVFFQHAWVKVLHGQERGVAEERGGPGQGDAAVLGWRRGLR